MERVININLFNFNLIKDKIKELLDLNPKSLEFKYTKDIINSNLNIFKIFLVLNGPDMIYIFNVTNRTKIIDIKRKIFEHHGVPENQQRLTISQNYKDYSNLIDTYKKEDFLHGYGLYRVMYDTTDIKLEDDKSLRFYGIKNENKQINEGRTLKLRLKLR